LYLIIKYAIMHYVYILQSQSTKDYYIGQTEDIEIRLAQHNKGFYTKAYTSNLKDWQLVHLITCNSITQAIKIESHIKRMKSRIYLESIQKYPEISQKLIIKYSD
jgi:putative endonuclease